MAMFRKMKNKENPYVMIDKNMLSNSSLSWKAKGILSYLLSLPDDWKIFENELVNHSKDGRESLRSGIKELISAGYIARIQLRDEMGRMSGYEYQVYEEPSVIVKPDNGELDIGKVDTTNNNKTDNDLTNKKPKNLSRVSENNSQYNSIRDKYLPEVKELAELHPSKVDVSSLGDKFFELYSEIRKKYSFIELKSCVSNYCIEVDIANRDKFKAFEHFFHLDNLIRYYENWSETLSKAKLDKQKQSFNKRSNKYEDSTGESLDDFWDGVDDKYSNSD